MFIMKLRTLFRNKAEFLAYQHALSIAVNFGFKNPSELWEADPILIF
jgi:hypothetical protein